jgi:D-serine deaminase-like pyridoxal phosphate-dependent protein
LNFMTSVSTWYTIDDADQLDSPALVFYPERIAENIRILKGSINDVSRLRPHVKTHKSREITELMLQAGIHKFKCATIAEAEMLGLCKAPDVLLAYQPVGPKISRLIALIKFYPETAFSCLVDHEDVANAIASAARAAGITVSVFLDLNVGMGRTGILPDERAAVFYRQISNTPGLKIKGLHAYDGHIHDASYTAREQQWKLALNAIMALKNKIMDLPEPVIVAGGTPTFPFYAQLEDQHIECSPGTFVLWDKGYQDAFTEQKYLTAALVITRVIALTDETKITVDLGHKSVAAENELNRRVYFLNAPDAKMAGQSEEHLVLEVGTDHGFKPGDVLYGLPIHICPTVALYGKADTVEDHHITGEWKIISRERKINI